MPLAQSIVIVAGFIICRVGAHRSVVVSCPLSLILSHNPTNMENFRTLQGLNSLTFTRPPLDGSLFLPEIYDYHAIHSPNHPLFVYEDAGSIHTISWSQGVRAVHNVARLIHHLLPPATAEDRKSTVIAILANAGEA